MRNKHWKIHFTKREKICHSALSGKEEIVLLGRSFFCAKNRMTDRANFRRNVEIYTFNFDLIVGKSVDSVWRMRYNIYRKEVMK